MTPPKSRLDTLIQEAKGERGPDVDWSEVEAKLFPRVEREARAQAALGAYAGSARAKRAWIAAACVMAAAASVPLFFPHGAATPLDGATADHPRSAGTLLEKDRTTTVHATRTNATREVGKGEALGLGDVVDARLGRAVFKRTDPTGVTWALEDGSQAEVRSTRGTLILALAKGAIEAQVAPVASGEAFAIDVEGSRVAVHGTHLRVERQGARAIVDLREGVVSIGSPPKSGSTYGDLVTAPAHVEFDPIDPHGTLKVTHEANRVRAAQTLETPSLATLPSQIPSIRFPPAMTSTPPRPAPPAAAPLPVAPAAPASPAVAVAVPPSSPAPPPPPAPASSAAVNEPVPPPPAPAHADPDPEKTIIEKVRACARTHVDHVDGVIVTVSSRLELRVGDGGMVTSAIFNPPLAPEIQTCASNAIFGTRFAQPGAVSIAIDVTP